MKKALLALGALALLVAAGTYLAGEQTEVVVLRTFDPEGVVHETKMWAVDQGGAPADGFAFGAPSIADVSVATFFRNARWARFRIDAARWPRAAAWVERTLDLPEFAALRPFEDLSIRTPIPELRAALAEAGAPLTADTCFTDTPRRGIMRI